MSLSLEQIESAEEMTLGERNRLVILESTIARGVQSFSEIGCALREVRDSRLYRATHGTFEAYTRDRWDMRREVADRLVRAAEVVEAVTELNPDGLAPATESQARELAPLLGEPEQLTRVWESATSTAAAAARPVTAADVRDARRHLDAPEPQLAPAAVPAEDDANDLRFAHIEEGVQLLRILPSPDRIVWPADEGDREAVGEAVEWLAKFAPVLARAWREDQRSRRRLRVV